MKTALIVVFAFVTLPLIAATTLVVVVAAGTGTTAIGAAPSAIAFGDVPDSLLAVYLTAATGCDGLPWQVIAGIGKVESDHARTGGATVDATGRVAPAIIGPRLDGTDNRQRVVDTDHGQLDDDVTFDRAVGPMQFLPTTWQKVGVDANSDAVADPNNIHDAVATTVRYMCPQGTIDDVLGALRRYNNSDTYADAVLAWARRYTAVATSAIANTTYALPLPVDTITRAQLDEPHHDYPAVDIAVPVGTAVFAISNGEIIAATNDDGGRCGGTIILSGEDGATYTYCHLSTVATTPGAGVIAGQLLGASGGMPGARGAGHTIAPHLHLDARINGTAVCPQQLLLAIYDGTAADIASLLATGCVAK